MSEHLRTIEERTVAAIIRAVRRNHISIDSATILDTLGLDSVDRLQILFELEEEFRILIPDRVARSASSVQEIVEKLNQLMEVIET